MAKSHGVYSFKLNIRSNPNCSSSPMDDVLLNILPLTLRFLDRIRALTTRIVVVLYGF